MRLELLAAAAMTIVVAATPVLAQEGSERMAAEREAPYMPYEDTVRDGFDTQAREAWLADCRQRLPGRHSRAIGRAGYPDARDECEAYLDDYYARYYSQGAYYQPYGYAPGYRPGYGYPAAGAQSMMMAPGPAKPQCTETVEYVYEDVPSPAPRKRYIPKRSKVVPDKRVRIR